MLIEVHHANYAFFSVFKLLRVVNHFGQTLNYALFLLLFLGMMFISLLPRQTYTWRQTDDARANERCHQSKRKAPSHDSAVVYKIKQIPSFDTRFTESDPKCLCPIKPDCATYQTDQKHCDQNYNHPFLKPIFNQHRLSSKTPLKLISNSNN